MEFTAEDLIDEFNKAITQPQKYREIFIKNMNEPNHRSAVLLKTQKPKQPVEIDYLLFKMADEILNDMKKNNSFSLNEDYSSIYNKYGKIKVPFTSSGNYNSNIKVDYIISKLLHDSYNTIFSDCYDSITAACSKEKNKIITLIIFYKNYDPLESDNNINTNYETNNNSNAFFQNQFFMSGKGNFPNQMMENIMGFNFGNFFNGNMFQGQNVKVKNMQNVNFNFGNNSNFQPTTNQQKTNEKPKNEQKTNDESKLFFLEETFNEMKELKENINKYKEFDQNGAENLINKIDEKIQNHNCELESIKECKKIIKDGKEWIENMKKKKYEKLEKENERINNELKRANKEKKEMENNYRVLIEQRNKNKNQGSKPTKK